MDNLILWAVALGIGVLGLLLLALAGAAAAYLNTRPRTVEDEAATRKPQATDKAATREARSHGAGFTAIDRGPSEGGGARNPSLWAWVKATIFALLHASAVSFVLGGATFFEDLVRANLARQRIPAG